jgi:hypothetical protein
MVYPSMRPDGRDSGAKVSDYEGHLVWEERGWQESDARQRDGLAGN